MNTLTVASGVDGTYTQYNGTGGKVDFSVGTLAASTIELTKNGGSLAFNAAALDMTANSTTLELDGTIAADVTLGDLTFDTSKSLSVTTANGTMTAGGVLTISGKDNTYNNAIASFAYDATSVMVDAMGMGAGDTALSGIGVMNLNNSVTVNNFDFSAFGLGEGTTLIQNVTGTYTAQTASVSGIDLDKERTTLITQSGSLASCLSKTTHNSAVTATVDISVSPGTFGPVTDAYDYGLDMNGHNLAVASSANSAATFTVANGLKASTVGLTQNTSNLIFTVDSLDVTGSDTNFILNNTAAANVTATNATLGNGYILSIDNANGNMNIGTLTVTGSGNRLAVATSAQAITTLNATNAGITFVLPSDYSGAQTVVTTTNAVIDIDVSGGVTLAQGQSFTLVSVSGSFSAAGINTTVGNSCNFFSLSVAGKDLLAMFSGLLTFEQATSNAFAGRPWHNVNLVSGAKHLDWLDGQPVDPTLWAKIENSFDDNLAPGGARAAAGLQQLYGAYAAYGNTALSADALRFRSRWQGQNHSFFNTHLFASPSVVAQGGPGIASDSGLASPVHGARDSIACGQSRVWAGGFGTWAKQDGKSGRSGYKYDFQGAILGYEYPLGNLNLGFAAAYSAGDLKANDLRYKNAAVVNLALYGAHVHESGVYAQTGLGYGHAWNDYKFHSVLVPDGVKKGKYGSNSFTADLELGYIARLLRDFNLIPSVGVEYTYLRNDSWTENVNNTALLANRFDSGHDNGVDIPLGLRFNRMFASVAAAASSSPRSAQPSSTPPTGLARPSPPATPGRRAVRRWSASSPAAVTDTSAPAPPVASTAASISVSTTTSRPAPASRGIT